MMAGLNLLSVSSQVDVSAAFAYTSAAKDPLELILIKVCTTASVTNSKIIDGTRGFSKD